MKSSFLKVATAVPKLCLANTVANTENIKCLIEKAEAKDCSLLVFPELSLTGSTCGDLFFNSFLISSVKDALFEITKFTKGMNITAVIGLPLLYGAELYNCAAVLKNGKILKIIPKTLDCKSPENRYFTSGETLTTNEITLSDGLTVPFDTKKVYLNSNDTEYSVSVIIGDSIVSTSLQNVNTDIVVNLASINQIAGRTEICRNAIKQFSASNSCNYILSSSGIGESGTDTVYAALSFIAQNGEILAENTPFCENIILTSEIELNRKNVSSINSVAQKNDISAEKNPFLPSFADKNAYLEEILQIQSHALARRIEHTHAKKAVIGISGGLDSTLALLVSERAMKILGRSSKDILCVTMPCFGTTSRTRSNSEILCNLLGTDFKEINIKKSVLQHFEDIGQSAECFDVTYENSQARERTQVLMDIANMDNGIVVGTGDLSELALGWATYNGDHMSMYAVNAGVPKTLVRHLVNYVAENSDISLKNVLTDILDTPVSPELLPADSKGKIAQKTEDLVGPYELHDFFLYHTVALCEEPKKIFESALKLFPEYDRETIKKWLTVFTRRFFNQQFKRSCLPDGPCVCEISLSPREAFKMPSDALSNIWLNEIEKL